MIIINNISVSRKRIRHFETRLAGFFLKSRVGGFFITSPRIRLSHQKPSSNITDVILH